MQLTPPSKYAHPSNKLYRGECLNFLDALQTYRASLQFELSNCQDGDGEEEFAAMLKASIEVVDKAEQEYLDVLSKAETTLAQEWHKRGDEFDDLANIMENGDDARLAI